MESYKQRRRPIDISAITTNIDYTDDFVIPPRDEYRSSYISEETTSTALETSRIRLCLIALICVLVIIGLLSVAGFIIGIVALVINVNKAGTTASAIITASATTITVTSPVVCTAIPTTTYQYSTVIPFQCSNYTLNTDGTRNIGYTTLTNFCDNVAPFNNNAPIWFRFQDPAGKVIANSAVPPNSCGAVVPGWYAGQYPIATFSTATSIVCYNILSNTCTTCNLISVTNCQTFYVFLLPQTPSCSYRYCTI